MSKDLEKENVVIKEKSIPVTDSVEVKTANEVKVEEELLKTSYLAVKKQDRTSIDDMIDEAENALADLRFRKSLVEADFSELLAAYQDVFVEQTISASTIAKSSLLEYFTFELLKPLDKIDLQLAGDRFESWETKHFILNFELVEEKIIEFQLVMPSAAGDRFTNPIRLMQVDPESMDVTVLNRGVLSLLKDCYGSHIYSAGQLSFVNHQMNEVMSHLRKLGFTVQDNLLDNSKPLNMAFDLPYVVSDDVLDEIFITTMSHKEYDFLKNRIADYTIDLGHEQTVNVQLKEKTTSIALDTDKMNKSILEFFGFYPFLVPLIMD